MRYVTVIFMALLMGTLIKSSPLAAQEPDQLPADEKLVILWSSSDRDVALKMVFMYTYNAMVNQWWKDITLVVWGPSAKLLAEDVDLQDYLVRIREAGVHVNACKGCSDQYGVSEKLQELGITVSYIGEEFTGYIKEGRHILTL